MLFVSKCNAKCKAAISDALSVYLAVIRDGKSVGRGCQLVSFLDKMFMCRDLPRMYFSNTQTAGLALGNMQLIVTVVLTNIDRNKKNESVSIAS